VVEHALAAARHWEGEMNELGLSAAVSQAGIGPVAA
jgi:hypothetical protein